MEEVALPRGGGEGCGGWEIERKDNTDLDSSSVGMVRDREEVGAVGAGETPRDVF